MNKKRAGFLFLLVVAVSITASLGFSVGSLFFSFELPIMANLILSQSIILVPGMIFLLVFESSKAELLHFKKIGLLDSILIVLYTFLAYPLVMFCNAASMIVTKNEVVAISDEILECPWYVILLTVGILGPVCEELMFRGMIYGGLRRSGRIAGALILQAVLFGLMHMNLNQMCYAIVIGIAMGLLVEATGSILSSCLMHIVINSSNVILMFLQEKVLSADGMQASIDAAQSISDDKLFMIITSSFLAVPAMIGCALALCLLAAISHRNRRGEWMKFLFLKGQSVNGPDRELIENRGEYFEDIPPDEGLFSVPLVAGILLASAMIAIDLLFESGLLALLRDIILNALMRG